MCISSQGPCLVPPWAFSHLIRRVNHALLTIVITTFVFGHIIRRVNHALLTTGIVITTFELNSIQ